jgi:ferredoxin
MGHLAGKEIFQKLEDKLDSLPFRVSKSRELYQILKALYSPDEAELVVKMPFGLSTLEVLEKATRFEQTKLISILESLCTKGLVVDIRVHGKYYYMPSPMVVGIFEFTMMRTGDELKSKEWAELFHNYLNTGEAFKVNFGNGQKISPLRTLPHEGTILDADFTEVLDYEKATSIVDSHKKFSIGLCSCRHEKHHLGEKHCDVPLETCITFGNGVDFMVRHNFAKEVSKTKILEGLSRSKEMGLVFSCDNARNNVSFLCQCCGCCCNVLQGISRFGYPNTIVTSGFIADIDQRTCERCGKCAKGCPIGAIEMVPAGDPERPGQKMPRTNTEICIGCGVCSLKCTKTGSLKLKKRKKRVIHPESTFERVILQCLERDTLQNQIFGNPEKISQKMMKGIIGGFLKLSPVKRALMSDGLRSHFLDVMKKGATRGGKDFLVKQYD